MKITSFAIDEEMKKQLRIIAASQDMSTSELLRAILTDFIEEYKVYGTAELEKRGI